MESELKRGGDHGRVLAKTLDQIELLAPKLNLDFVIDAFDDFVTIAQMRRATNDASDALVKKDIEGARQHMWTALQARPQSIRLADPWGDPLPPPFPTEILPSRLLAYVRRQSEITGIAPAPFAWSALALGTAALASSIRLQMKQDYRDWTEPASLWLLLIGPPSSRKSAVLKATWGPLKRIQAREMAELKAERAAWSKADKETLRR